MCKHPCFKGCLRETCSSCRNMSRGDHGQEDVELSNEEYEEEERSEEDTFSILVATDIHLGYAEKDPITTKDTFETFEEILKIAQEYNVDFLLLGGDLFHETRPSTYCLYKCIDLLKRYCLGDRPIQIEFLSDPSHNFSFAGNDTVNYEDPNLNVGIPVFSIHGNHDDPTGENQISAMNLLATSGLVNYFGKQNSYDSVEIEPILLKKGQSKLALYGLSHVKDDRLARLFLDKKVTVMAPTEEDYFHLLVLHQNRANRGAKSFIPDNCLPEVLDLAIWGHEHDCRIEPEQTSNSVFICQPGSSVATSLSVGESLTKHVGLLQIHRKQFHITPIQLKTVRPFVYREMVLKDVESMRKEIAEDGDEEVSNQLIAEKAVELEIDTMIQKAKELGLEGNKLPLLRLMVQYVDESQTFNTIRFGQRYVGRAANPREIVKLRSLIKVTKKDDHGLDEYLGRANINLPNRVEDLVMQYFEENSDRQLKCLSLKALNQSVIKCIDAAEQEAPMEVTKLLVKQLNEKLVAADVDVPDVENFLFSVKDGDDDQDLVDKVLKNSGSSKKTAKNLNGDRMGIDDASEPDSDESRSPVGLSPARGRAPARPARGPGSGGGRGSRGGRGGRGRAKAT